MSVRILFFTLFVMAMSVTASVQAAERYTFDKAHTQILFFADHLGFSQSQGEFHDYDGHFMIDRSAPENSSVEVTIKTASIDMDDDKWDAHLKNEDFFHVEKHPEMTFKSTSVELEGDDKAHVMGDLTMLGQTHPVTLHVTHNKSGKHPFSGKHVAGFSAHAEIDRSQWGMDYGLPMMDPKVTIRIEVEGVKDMPEADK